MKFADNDLIGLPYQIVVGKKGLAENSVEFKDRRSGERDLIALDQAVSRVSEEVAAQRERLGHASLHHN